MSAQTSLCRLVGTKGIFHGPKFTNVVYGERFLTEAEIEEGGVLDMWMWIVLSTAPPYM